MGLDRSSGGSSGAQWGWLRSAAVSCVCLKVQVWGKGILSFAKDDQVLQTRWHRTQRWAGWDKEPGYWQAGRQAGASSWSDKQRTSLNGPSEDKDMNKSRQLTLEWLRKKWQQWRENVFSSSGWGGVGGGLHFCLVELGSTLCFPLAGHRPPSYITSSKRELTQSPSSLEITCQDRLWGLVLWRWGLPDSVTLDTEKSRLGHRR